MFYHPAKANVVDALSRKYCDG
jgi:hypothetical protein